MTLWTWGSPTKVRNTGHHLEWPDVFPHAGVVLLLWGQVVELVKGGLVFPTDQLEEQKNGRRNECILRTSKLNKGTVWNSTTSKTHLALMGHGFSLCSASIINIKLMLCKAFTAYLCVTHNMLVLWLLKWRLFCDTMIQQKNQYSIQAVFKLHSYLLNWDHDNFINPCPFCYSFGHFVRRFYPKCLAVIHNVQAYRAGTGFGVTLLKDAYSR